MTYVDGGGSGDDGEQKGKQRNNKQARGTQFSGVAGGSQASSSNVPEYHLLLAEDSSSFGVGVPDVVSGLSGENSGSLVYTGNLYVEI